MKPITPYNRLLAQIQKFCRDLRFRHKKIMWMYSKDQLNVGWTLSDLYQRVAAAEQLGYDVVLTATDEGLIVTYVKCIPEIPWNWR